MPDLRRRLLVVHRWTGLCLGFLIAFLAITGGAITFRPQLDTLAYPSLYRASSCAAPVAVDRVVAAARARRAGVRVTYVYLYGAPRSSAMVRFADADQVYVDPCTARVLGDQQRYAGLFGMLEGLHKFRFAGGTAGLPIVGSIALLLAALLVVIGVYVWWPRRRAGLRLNLRLRGRARGVNVHTTLGVYAAIAVFVIAATAVPLSLAWARSALFALTASQDMTEDGLRPHTASGARGAHIALQVAWEAARATYPGALGWGSLRVPKAREPIEVTIVLAGAVHGEARNLAFVNARTGAIVDRRPYATLNRGTKAYYWALALHTGRAGGAIVRAIMVLAMIALCSIVYTGYSAYIRALLRRRSASLAKVVA